MLCPQGFWFELQHHQFNRPSQKYMSWLTQEKRWSTQSERMANTRTQMVIFTFHLCWRYIGLWPGWFQVSAKIRQCPLVTACGTLAHKKLLGYLLYISSLPDESTLQLPSLCLHHRTGNIIEKITELTGSLTGHYAFSRPRSSEENIEYFVVITPRQTLGYWPGSRRFWGGTGRGLWPNLCARDSFS